MEKNIINSYFLFIFSLILFINNHIKKRIKIIKATKIKSYILTPISYQKSILISYLRKKNIDDKVSLFLLNFLYLSSILSFKESVERKHKIRYMSDLFILITLIQETKQNCFFCGERMNNYNILHNIYAIIAIIFMNIETFYYKYNKFIFFILFGIFLNMPYKNIFKYLLKSKYKRFSKKNKKKTDRNIFFIEIIGLIYLFSSRIFYDMHNS